MNQWKKRISENVFLDNKNKWLKTRNSNSMRRVIESIEKINKEKCGHKLLLVIIVSSQNDFKKELLTFQRHRYSMVSTDNHIFYLKDEVCI